MPPKKKTKPNEKCPCGSGKKHKKCCMVAGSAAASSATITATVLEQELRLELQRDQEKLKILRQQLSNKEEEERQASQHLRQLITQHRGLPRTDAWSFSTATTVVNEVMEALSLTPTTAAATSAATTAASDIIGPCCHGSTSDHFSDGLAYRDLIQNFLSEETVNKFEEGHLIYLQDLNFVQYIFALCTSWYLKTNQSTEEMNYLLKFAIQIKYIHLNDGKFNSDQVKRYVRAINKNDDRDVINCLSRETKSYCDCMKAKKKEATGMAKIELCYGCHSMFPRDGMLICSGCNYAMFCDEDCQAKNWPNHREACKMCQKSRIFS